MTATSMDWGVFDGQAVKLWSLQRMTRLGLIEIRVADYGATLQSVILPDANGVRRDVTLGHDSLEEYIASDAYFGAVLGGFASRLRNGLRVLACCRG